jgi:hypothetical protein
MNLKCEEAYRHKEKSKKEPFTKFFEIPKTPDVDPEEFKHNSNVQCLLSIFRVSVGMDISFKDYIETFKNYPVDDIIIAISLYLQEKRKSMLEIFKHVEHREKVLSGYRPDEESKI